ncbi:hypothetical protein EVAR_38317_1 [Eumeta japonica]|uniref:Uncharacterized protein n=1 Tax=Eumeta variegata TaxID=151549 RepID=A0A4C1WAN6_EUMVA|nr:hypothetical protein EVAR_38317_1 [Eumeta japonica]
MDRKETTISTINNYITKRRLDKGRWKRQEKISHESDDNKRQRLEKGAGAGRRTYYCLMPGRLLVGDTTPKDQVAMVRTIVSEILPVPSPHRPRARAYRACAAGRWRGASGLVDWFSTRVRGSSSCTRSRLPVVRTLVGADRIRRARIGDPAEPHPSTSSFCPILGRDVNPVPTPGHPRARASPRMRSALVEGTGLRKCVDEGGGRGTTRSTHADDRRPPEADERRPRRGSAPATQQQQRSHASVSSYPLLLLALVRVVYPIGEGPAIRVIVPTTSGEAPRRLQHGEARASDTSASGSAGAVPAPLHVRWMPRHKIAGRSGARRVARRTARVFGSTHARGRACVGSHGRRARPQRPVPEVFAMVFELTRGRLDGSGELASDPAAPRRGVRCGPLPGVNCRISVRSWVFLTLFFSWVWVRDGGLIFCLMPGRLLVGDTTRRLKQ